MAKRKNKIVGQIVKKAGGINKLANICGVTRQVVQGWIYNGLPEKPAIIKIIETNLGVPREEMKPEWYEWSP